MTDTSNSDQAWAPADPVYEIRVRQHSGPDWITLEDKPADLDVARDLAAFRALRQTPTPAEVLVVGEWGPAARWLDGKEVRLESLTPGHPGGCTCGECVIRWEHREGGPRHQPCPHGACHLCNGCEACDWDAAANQLQELAAREMTEAEAATLSAGNRILAVRRALDRLRREIGEAEIDVEGLPGADITAALAKLDRIAEDLDDVTRITQLYRLRAQLTELGKTEEADRG